MHSEFHAKGPSCCPERLRLWHHKNMASLHFNGPIYAKRVKIADDDACCKRTACVRLRPSFVHTWSLRLHQCHCQSLTLYQCWHKRKCREWVWNHHLHQYLCCYWHNVKLWWWRKVKRQVWTGLKTLSQWWQWRHSEWLMTIKPIPYVTFDTM